MLFLNLLIWQCNFSSWACWCNVCCVLSHVQLVWPCGMYLPGFSVHRIFQARLLEWFVISSSRGSSWPKDQACIYCASYVWGGFFIHWAIREFHQFSSVTQSCLTLCDPMNCSMAGLPVHQLPGWKEQQQSQPVLPCCSKDAFTFSLSLSFFFFLLPSLPSPSISMQQWSFTRSLKSELLTGNTALRDMLHTS